ncbi:MAG: sigma-70 family RNA polymerase sigma factor [Bacteroidales bacterium]|jgi:RNA polymerase sigma factor (sigma-70 family)|nr:sigma-70 family RNA polymerase sigma factor [Bacteroidales bacterium]
MKATNSKGFGHEIQNFQKNQGDKSPNPVLIDKEMAVDKDKRLIEGIRKQDERIITEMYTAYFPSVRHYIYRNNGSAEDARDIFHDAFVVLLEKIRENSLDLNCSLKTYLYAVCKNLWLKKISSYKTVHTQYSDLEDTLAGANPINQEFYDINRAYLLYQKQFAKMSPTCRKLIQYFLEGYSYQEITRLMNYENEGYARKRKYRCIKILIKRIKTDPDYKTIYDD